MKASHQITVDGVYHVQVTIKPVADAQGGGTVTPAPLFLYKNRVRLVATESLPVARWDGPLRKGDLLEADSPVDVELHVEEKTDAPRERPFARQA